MPGTLRPDRGCATSGCVNSLPSDDAQRVVAQAHAAGLTFVWFLYADHSGIIRGKAASLPLLAERMHTGIGDTAAAMGFSMLDSLHPVDGIGVAGEIRIVADPATFVTLPYAPGAGAMIADLTQPDGGPWDACSRGFLKEAIAELASAGYALSAAFEPEFTLGSRVPDPQGGPDRLVPVDDSLGCSATGFHIAHDFAVELARALEAQGMLVEHYHPELGHGQQEMSIRHAPALQAADNHILYRETARGVAFRRGQWASLAPMPVPGQAGNGAHLHASLWEMRGAIGQLGSQNVFHDPSDRYGLSETGYHFIGGLLAHLPALTALTCGSVNSYRRIAPQAFSSAYTIYGMDNREAAIRICSPMRDDQEGTVNLEFKPSDSSANPYLALGAYIHAGLDGIRRKLDPGEAVNVDPETLTSSERSRRGAHRLPLSLTAALTALEADDLLIEALGSTRRNAYLAIKRAEADTFAKHSIEYECFHHFTKF